MGYRFEELQIGMSASYTRCVTESDIADYARISGDTNPLHLDERFAARSIFGSRIAHGLLTASFISAVIGTRLPGDTAVYLSQSLRFLAPVRIGDEVTAKASVTALDAPKRRATLETICTVADKPVLSGEALILIP
ncbi:MAG TPA: MaoC family dehydratase [Rhizobiales bacterium]|nr:MaoC family dehydratase [Hyphomicrobiales bacterium]